MKIKSKIVLASASPRRKELLEQAGLEFDVVISGAEENTSQTKPSKMAEEVACIKCRGVLDKLVLRNEYDRDTIVIAADTVVASEDKVFGKPSDKEEALSILMQLSGRTHSVYTGVCLGVISDNLVRDTFSFYEETRVEMYPFTKEEALDYIATGEPMDKAGAYGIQGKGFLLVKGIQGDYNNVVGLPLSRLVRELGERGIFPRP